jgi:hypothetical protein
MKEKFHLSFVRRLRRMLRLLVTESAYRHNPLLINRLAAFNFPRPLEFPGQRLAGATSFSQ